MNENSKKTSNIHFKGKDAIEHVAEAQAEGRIAASEIHGMEVPGHISAGADSARDMSAALLLLWMIVERAHFAQIFSFLLVFALGWTIWKAGRSAWLGWFRLERMHRVLNQEKWEIEHNEQQEREELTVLYAAKGFEGKLLTDVIDVLMADGDRLLKVMVEEELGLSLEAHDHPLKQSLGALIGCLAAASICLAAYFAFPLYGLPIGGLTVIAISAVISAKHAQNRLIPAIVWNVGLGILSFGCVYFLIDYFFSLKG